MPIDPNTNLLLDILPRQASVGSGLVRDFELLQSLSNFFRSSRSEEGSREVIFPNSDAAMMRAVFSRDGGLVGLYALDGLTEAVLAAVREHVRAELVETTGVAIGREILFSLAPVQGWWRHGNFFQILPVPSHAPRPDFAYARHPFLLEVPYSRAGHPFVDHARRCRAARPVHLVLNALLTTPIWWEGDRSVGTHGRSWVLTTEPPEEWKVAYLQHSYSYAGHTPTSEVFSPVEGTCPIASVPAADYYRDAYRTTGDALVIPGNLGQSFDLFAQLRPHRRRKFLRACFWLNQVHQVESFSLMFISAVQAIDALLPAAPSGVRCKECGLERRSSRTTLFVEFLNRFAPSPMVMDADRRALFEIRSHLSHGFRDPLIADQEVGYGLHPDANAEYAQGNRVLQTARIALYNWLHTPEATDGPNE